LSKRAQTKQHKVLQSLLDHWSGLTLFVEHPEIPMDNNLKIGVRTQILLKY
jgi:hypothetical protein